MNAIRTGANPIMRCLLAACTALLLAACGAERDAPGDVQLPALIPAPLHIEQGDRAVDVDARPSDSIALAVRARCPNTRERQQKRREELAEEGIHHQEEEQAQHEARPLALTDVVRAEHSDAAHYDEQRRPRECGASRGCGGCWRLGRRLGGGL